MRSAATDFGAHLIEPIGSILDYSYNSHMFAHPVLC